MLIILGKTLITMPRIMIEYVHLFRLKPHWTTLVDHTTNKRYYPVSGEYQQNNKGKVMRFAKLTCWIFSGFMLTASGVYAQEVAQKTRPLNDQATQPPSDADEKPLREAEALMKAGKPADAYNLLEPLEFNRAGELRFDYLLGTAALDSGKADKATLAFERVLAVDVNFAGARLDMARAYYQLGDLPRAKTEFEAVLKQNPPEAARATIQKYLSAIDAQQAIKKTRYNIYLEAGLGYNSNVNNSTNQPQIFVPGLLGGQTFTLSQSNLQTADYYYALALGGEASHDLNSNWGLYAGGDVRQRGHQTQNRFNTLNLDGRAGIAYSFSGGTNTLRVGALKGSYYLGTLVGGLNNPSSAFNRDFTGYSADLRHVYNPANQVSVFAQKGSHRFVETAMRVNNFDQATVGTGWMHVLADGQSIVFGSVFMATEDDVAPVTPTNPNGGRADGNKSTQGLRAGGQTTLKKDLDIFASIGLQAGSYSKTHLLFSRRRQDSQRDLAVGANWHWDKDLTLRPQVNYSNNTSNISIYQYNQLDISLTVRRDFR